MSPPRRRSARLASASKSFNRSIFAPPSLSSLAEHEEAPTHGVTESIDAIVSSPPPTPKTPATSSPVKPPLSEMHPSKVHPTMAAPSSGLRFGFTDINPSQGTGDQPSGITQSTPSKTTITSSPFTFRLTREASDLKLGPAAQQLMDELREEALKIKADLAAKRELEKMAETQVTGRKIAQPKGKANRFSAAHMAQFKKMDSIENHPSAFRAQSGRSTPVITVGVKRSPSKANLDDFESVRSKHAASTSSAKKSYASASYEPVSPAKRARQHIDDDASSSRPVSRDDSSIPRPKSAGKSTLAIPRSQTTLASLMTPTKASLARAAVAKETAGLPVKSPSIANLSGIKRSATTNNLAAKVIKEVIPEERVRKLRSPVSRFDKVKSILRGTRPTLAKAESGILLPSGPALSTPCLPNTNKALPTVPSTTPGRKLTKRVVFTPDVHRAALAQKSPTAFKSGIPKSKTRPDLGEVHYPTLDTVMAEGSTDGEVSYPKLPDPLPLPDVRATGAQTATLPETVPGTFTFRSDHTIRFGDASPTGFGPSRGQASLRHVRPSILPTAYMPGSFPTSIFSSSPEKENQAPELPLPPIPHGLSKKRQRVSSDEEEGEERAAKKQKNEPVPEGLALLAPRLVDGTGKKVFSSPTKGLVGGGMVASSPGKKKSGLSLSRLNMLARPKFRK